MNSLSEGLTTSWLFQRLYSQKIGEAALKHNISKTEADILLFLFNNPRYDTAKDIVNIRGIAKSYVSRSIEALTEKNFIILRQDRDDRRVVHLELTGEALKILKDLSRVQKEIFILVTKDIPEKRKKEVALAFRQISRNIKEAL